MRPDPDGRGAVSSTCHSGSAWVGRPHLPDGWVLTCTRHPRFPSRPSTLNTSPLPSSDLLSALQSGRRVHSRYRPVSNAQYPKFGVQVLIRLTVSSLQLYLILISSSQSPGIPATQSHSEPRSTVPPWVKSHSSTFRGKSVFEVPQVPRFTSSLQSPVLPRTRWLTPVSSHRS